MRERGNPLLKKIDRYAGIPLVFFLGLLHKKKALPKDKKLEKGGRFLFLKTGAIGDSILLSAIALELKEKYPESQISLLCTRANYGIVPLLAGIDDVLLFNLSNFWVSLKKLKQNRAFDFVIDFAAWPRLNSMIAFFSPADFRIGFQSEGQYRHYVYDRVVQHRASLHELENYKNLLHALGIETKGILPRMNIGVLKKKFENKGIGKQRQAQKNKKLVHSSANSRYLSSDRQREKIEDIISQYKKPVIFHPFPGGFKKEFKMWPSQNWELLGNEVLLKEHSIWITGGDEEQEEAQNLADRIVLNFVKGKLQKLQTNTAKTKKTGASLKKQNRVLSLAGQLTWEETAYLLLKSRVLVSVNTGIMHLGAALGCKVIALNGPTAITRWGALGKDVTNFRSNYECSPCLNLGFEYGCVAGGCMTRIKVENVAKAMEKI